MSGLSEWLKTFSSSIDWQPGPKFHYIQGILDRSGGLTSCTLPLSRQLDQFVITDHSDRFHAITVPLEDDIIDHEILFYTRPRLHFFRKLSRFCLRPYNPRPNPR